MSTVLTFGKHKNEMLEMTPESYIKWLATHKAVLSPEHRTVSDAAKKLLEKEEETMTYEEYQNEILYIMWDEEMSDSEINEEIAELEAQHPQYAARAKAEADAKRGDQQSVQEVPEKEVIFVLKSYRNVGNIIEDDGHQYRVVEDPSWMSAREAAEIAQFADPSAESGWYTKAVLVA